MGSCYTNFTEMYTKQYNNNKNQLCLVMPQFVLDAENVK